MGKIALGALVQEKDKLAVNCIPAPIPNARKFLEGFRRNNKPVQIITPTHYILTLRWLENHNLKNFVDEILYENEAGTYVPAKKIIHF